MKQGKIGLHLHLAREMQNFGWDVQIITASTSHPAGAQFLPSGISSEVVHWENTDSLFVRARRYEGNGVSRLINMAEFGSRMFRRTTVAKLPQPRVIIGRITNPLAALAALRWSRHFRVPFVLEISDIWPDTFVQLGALSKNDPRTQGLGRIEKWLIRSSSAVMSPLPGVGQYLRDSGFPDLPFYWVPNGAASSSPDTTREEPNEQKAKFRFVYVGSLGNANAVDTIIKAFDRYATENNDSKSELEIIGSGPLLVELQRHAEALPSATQIRFIGRVPHEDVPRRLRLADALVANMRDLPLYRYGIALNKIFDYLLSAKPIIFATNASNNLVLEAQAGISVGADDEKAIAVAMKDMITQDPKVRSKWGEAGRKFVLDNYSYERSAEKFNVMLNGLAERT